MVAGLAASESIVVPDRMLTGMGVRVVQDEVTRVDALQRTVAVTGGETFPYDKLFLATGSSSFVPPIEGSDLAGIMTLRGLDDAERIRNYLEEKKPKNIVFIGAGFISMEIASLLAETSPGAFGITVVELMDRPLPLMLDKDMGDAVGDKLNGAARKGEHNRRHAGV